MVSKEVSKKVLMDLPASILAVNVAPNETSTNDENILGKNRLPPLKDSVDVSNHYQDVLTEAL